MLLRLNWALRRAAPGRPAEAVPGLMKEAARGSRVLNVRAQQASAAGNTAQVTRAINKATPFQSRSTHNSRPSQWLRQKVALTHPQLG